MMTFLWAISIAVMIFLMVYFLKLCNTVDSWISHAFRDNVNWATTLLRVSNVFGWGIFVVMFGVIAMACFVEIIAQ